MVHTVDFRSLYASVLEGWLGAPSEGVAARDLRAAADLRLSPGLLPPSPTWG